MPKPCSNHLLDDFGWPQGDCAICQAYRKQMNDWYFAQVLLGNPDPDRYVEKPEFELGL